MSPTLIALALPILLLLLFVRAARRMRKGSGGMANVMLGATDYLLTEDKKRGVEVVVQQASDARLEDEGSEADEL